MRSFAAVTGDRHFIRRLRRAFMFAAASLLALFPDVAITQGRHLELEELFARTLPAEFELAGASVRDSTSILLWARNQRHLLLQRGDSLWSIASEEITHPVAAALVVGDTIVEVVDVARRTILEVRLDGSLVKERPVGTDLFVETAVRTESGWVFGGTSPDGTYMVVRAGEDLTATVLYTFNAAVGPTYTPVSTLLSTDGQRIFIAEVEEPFRALVVDPDGTVAAWPPRTSPRADESGIGGAPHWVALPIVALDSDFVQTFADLRSDLRSLNLYDADGTPLREQRIQLPLAVVASIPGSNRLVAARRTNVLEVVVYNWSWSVSH